MERVVGRVPVGDVGTHREGWVCDGLSKAQEDARDAAVELQVAAKASCT